ncbi:hypothetical protein [Pontibacter liquoris]|uniref:hypothetical protein n=1 Tax=Pontibacter liquoris TaxID=2905677 RepID=UPI001FA746E4|nr:hypothetical protein [Pontibacter liquoris]
MAMIPNMIFLGMVVLYLTLLSFMLTWVYFDAEQRGINGWVIVLFTFLSGTLAGILGWLLLRPKLQPQPIPVRK